MKSPRLLLVVASTVVLSFSSCNKDDDSNGPNGPCVGYSSWALSLSDEAAALSSAASTYGQDPTTENCQAYKQAYIDYIDAAENISSCVPAGQKAAYQQSLDDARDSLNDLPC